MTYYGQEGQDAYLEKYYFKGFKNGFFVDVGAHNGETYNNTLFFEESREWKGINFEPIKEVYDQLAKRRPKCININSAVTSYDGTADFICNTGYTEMISGLKDTFDPRHHERLNEELAEMGGESKVIKVNTCRLESIFDKYNVKRVNLLSVDVEGAEFDVIKSINFDKVYIDIIMFENNYEDNSQPIIDYLTSKNYVFLWKGLDVFMIHKYSMFI